MLLQEYKDKKNIRKERRYELTAHVSDGHGVDESAESFDYANQPVRWPTALISSSSVRYIVIIKYHLVIYYLNINYNQAVYIVTVINCQQCFYFLLILDFTEDKAVI